MKKSYEDVTVEIKKTWKKFIESSIVIIIILFLIYYWFIIRENRNVTSLKRIIIIIALCILLYIVKLVKLYFDKRMLKKKTDEIDVEKVEEEFAISNYESYNKLKLEVKNCLKKYLVILIILSTIFGIFYIYTGREKEKYLKEYNSDKWYVESAMLDHYDSPKNEDAEFSKGYFYYTGKDGKTYEYIDKIGSIDRDNFNKEKEIKRLIYVSETDNSKSMKYEEYNSKYELINKFFRSIIFVVALLFGIKMLILISRIIFEKSYIK